MKAPYTRTELRAVGGGDVGARALSADVLGERLAGFLDAANFLRWRGMHSAASLLLDELQRRNEQEPRVGP